MARCEELEKALEELTTLLKDYKTRLQNGEQDVMKKDNMLTTLDSTVACLLESQEKLKAENQCFTLVNTALVNR